MAYPTTYAERLERFGLESRYAQRYGVWTYEEWSDYGCTYCRVIDGAYELHYGEEISDGEVDDLVVDFLGCDEEHEFPGEEQEE